MYQLHYSWLAGVHRHPSFPPLVAMQDGGCGLYAPACVCRLVNRQCTTMTSRGTHPLPMVECLFQSLASLLDAVYSRISPDSNPMANNRLAQMVSIAYCSANVTLSSRFLPASVRRKRNRRSRRICLNSRDSHPFLSAF